MIIRPAEHKLARLALLAAVGTLAWPGRAGAAPVPAALFGFELYDTSLQGEMRGNDPEQARLPHLDAELRDLLQRDGRYVAVDTAPVAAEAKGVRFRTCNGCEADLARKLGARVSVIGWVQKVSNLILNVNVEMRDAATGDVIHGASVDIRGDTEESWSRGLAYLVDNRLFLAAPAPTP